MLPAYSGRLQRDVSVTGDVDAIQRRHMLNVLQESLDAIGGGAGLMMRYTR